MNCTCGTCDQLATALELLKHPGSVLLIPTETVYGLVCDWQDQLARERIYQLKGRADNKPLTMFAASGNMAQQYGVKLNCDAELLLQAFTPGPVTIITPGDDQYPTIGLRIPDHPLVLELLKRHNRPLASTSANASGMPNARTVSEALQQLHGQVDWFFDAGALSDNAVASTVVSVCESPCRILRQGPVSEKAINQVLHQ